MRRMGVRAAATWLLLVLAGMTVRAETYARNFELRTLDARYAASLVVELCEAMGKNPGRCEVHLMHRKMISVFSSPDVHSEVTKLLARVDSPVPASLGFRIISARFGEGDPTEKPAPPEIEKALDAVRELLGLNATAIQDTGLIWTADCGKTRLACGDGRLHEVSLQIRSVVTRSEGRELTVELEARAVDPSGTSPPLLSSVVTLRVGETVVAGTSRTGPEETPFLLLLTSLPVEPARGAKE